MTIRRLAATGRAAATPGAPLSWGAAPSSSLRSSDSAAPEPSGPWSTGLLARSRLLPMCPDRSVTHVPGCTGGRASGRAFGREAAVDGGGGVRAVVRRGPAARAGGEARSGGDRARAWGGRGRAAAGAASSACRPAPVRCGTAADEGFAAEWRSGAMAWPLVARGAAAVRTRGGVRLGDRCLRAGAGWRWCATGDPGPVLAIPTRGQCVSGRHRGEVSSRTPAENPSR